MWTWIKDWFINKRPSAVDDVSTAYKPAERVIYRYWDGKETVAADPMVLFKGIMAAGADLFIDLKVAMSPSKDASKALDNSVRKVRGIFKVKPFEEGGLTEAETMALLDHFLAYVDGLKKNSRTYPTSSMATSVPSGPSADGGQPTPNSSDSGSTATAPPTVEPTTSPSGPASPSVA